MENNASRSAYVEEIQTSVNTLTHEVGQIINLISPVESFITNSSNLKRFTNDSDSIINKCKILIKLITNKIDEVNSFTQDNFDDKPDIKTGAEKILENLNESLDCSNATLQSFEKAKASGEKWCENEVYSAYGRFDSALKSLENKIKSSTSYICNNWNKLRRVIKFRPKFRVPTVNKKCYVLLIANSTFKHNRSLCSLDAIKEDVSLTEEFKQNNLDRFDIDIVENLTSKQTDEKLKELEDKDFSNHSSIVIIFDSHGDKNEIIYPTDGNPNDSNPTSTNMQSSELWEWTAKNSSIVHQPVVVVVETCRGGKEEQRCSIDINSKYQSSSSFVNYPNSPNLLVVYAAAYGYTALCDKKKGSDFLITFFDILKDNITKHWDILAQITEASRRVIQAEKDSDRNQTQTQTVNFVSLLPSQLHLGYNEIEHDWKDVKPYELRMQQQKMRAIFLVHESMINEAQTLKTTMEAVGIQIISQTLPCVPNELLQHIPNINEISVIFVVVIGLTDNENIHKDHMPNFREEMSHTKNAALVGIPKVVFFLGKQVTPQSIDDSSTNNAECLFKGTKHLVSQNSDFLAYCDSNEDWLETMQEILMAAPGNEEGLVRLLTTRGMARRPALLSDSPPYIESSLIFKLVLPKTEQIIEEEKVKEGN